MRVTGPKEIQLRKSNHPVPESEKIWFVKESQDKVNDFLSYIQINLEKSFWRNIFGADSWCKGSDKIWIFQEKLLTWIC